jgi:hypothetical protein
LTYTGLSEVAKGEALDFPALETDVSLRERLTTRRDASQGLSCRTWRRFSEICWESRVLVDTRYINLFLGKQDSPVEGGPLEVGPLEVGACKEGPPEVSPQKVGVHKVGVHKVGPLQVGPLEVGPLKVSPREEGSPKVSPLEVSVREVGLREVGVREVGVQKFGSQEVGPLGAKLLARRSAPRSLAFWR